MKPRLYNTKAWYRLRWYALQREPLCRFCKQMGRVVAGSVVDHITPHRGDAVLFHDEKNLQVLCKPCHDRHKQRQEHTGILVGGDTNGNPVDANHHWNLE